MKKPYLISVASSTLGVHKNYIRTLPNLKDSVELVYVDCDPCIPDPGVLEEHLKDVRYIKARVRYPGHHHRWQLIPNDLDQDRWWIFTDNHDVIFQGPIPDLDQFGADILVQAEGMTHEENGVWKNCLETRWPELRNLLALPVYCCGVVAAKGCLLHRYKNWIYGFPPDVWDQLPFNEWLIGKNYADCPELSASLYDNLYADRLCRVGGFFTWVHTGVRPAIVHGNGSSKKDL
jgi:hypothetical protein